MGSLIALPRRAAAEERSARPAVPVRDSDPAAAARGVLLALALSSLFWIALALLVPRLW
jgi:hypothetical protein